MSVSVTLPCIVGDTVWYISERIETQGKKKTAVPFIDKGIVDNITFGQTMVPQITVCDDGGVWTTFDGYGDIGKLFFLTEGEAVSALKELDH